MSATHPIGPPARDQPLYPMGVASELLLVHPRTLRFYEQKGLLRPARRSGRRYYSDDDLRWSRCIMDWNHRRGLSLDGIRRLLDFLPCWGIGNRALTRRPQDPGEVHAGRDLVRRAGAGEAEPECLTCGNYLRGMGRALGGRAAASRAAAVRAEPGAGRARS